MSRPNTHVPNPIVEGNTFIKLKSEDISLPNFSEIKSKLPVPVWNKHNEYIDCYWKTWEIAFSNLGQPKKGTKFVSNFIDTAFNGCIFMWDSVFILMFGKYASSIFNFQKTLDNFYSHQHEDGFISKEIRESDSLEMFDRFDYSSTGPNIMPWSEWEYFQITHDKERLEKVFPVLLAYNRWYQKHRTWQDGSYWSSGWGCGMDNQPRIANDYQIEFDHGHISWIDITLQQIFSDKILVKMANVLGQKSKVEKEEDEIKHLTQMVNEKMWDDKSAFYYDKDRNGNIGNVKTIGAYWALLADCLPEDKKDRFIDHLRNEKEFNRPHRVPTLSADHPLYDEKGNYWLGSIWAPTNYMVLKGLSECCESDLAFDIAKSHVDNVVKVFMDTGTLWENYAPEAAERGSQSKSDFVGWTGLSSISVLFEYVFGIKSDYSNNHIEWDVRQLEEHGIKQYPFGEITVDLLCKERISSDEEPSIEIIADEKVKVLVKWNGLEKEITN